MNKIILILMFTSFSAWALPKRLVLSVDGVSFYDIRRMQKGHQFVTSDGRLKMFKAFNNFYPVSKNISPWPALSDIAWTDIFQLVPMPGYQKYHFSHHKQEIVGVEGLTDMGTLADYERLQHWTMEGTWDHLMGYLFPQDVFAKEIDQIVENFFASESEDIFYAYLVSTDDIQHMNGNVIEILEILDQKLKAMQTRYFDLTGKRLELILLSDHGNNKSPGGIRVGIGEFLVGQGMQLKEKLEKKYDVVIPISGILNVASIYVFPEDIQATVNILRHLDGLEVITFVDVQNPSLVWVTDGLGKLASIERKIIGGEVYYRYLVRNEDPLDHYQKVAQNLIDRGLAEPSGFIKKQFWFWATKDLFYPAAVDRIFRGHTEITLNPAPIIVGLKRGYENAGRLTKTLSELVTTGGTHGGLEHVGSNGIVMTNFMPTIDSTTDQVANQFNGFDRTKNFKEVRAGNRLANVSLLSRGKKEHGLVSLIRSWFSPVEIFFELWGSPVLIKLKSQGKVQMVLLQRLPGQVYDSWPVVKNVEVEFCQGQNLCLNDSAFVSLAKNLGEKFLPKTQYYLSLQGADAEEIASIYFDTDAQGKVILY